MAKNLVSGPTLAQIQAANFFFFFFSKLSLCQSLDSIASYHHVQYQKKLMIQSWENLAMDVQTNQQRDESIIIIISLYLTSVKLKYNYKNISHSLK